MVYFPKGGVCPTKPPGVSDDRAKSDRIALPVVLTAPTPGGEPLYKMAALSDGSKRLPETAPGVAIAHDTWSVAVCMTARPRSLGAGQWRYQGTFPGAAGACL
jgi:hypothetical protein